MEGRSERRRDAGLRLALAAAVVVGGAVLFSAIVQNVLGGGHLTVVDMQIASWFAAHSAADVTPMMLLISQVHGTGAILAMACAVALIIAWNRDWYWFMTLIVAVPGGMIVNRLIKEIVERPRPDIPDGAMSLTSFSFPSGHAAAATLFYGFLLVYVVARVKRWRWRVLIALLAVLLVGLVGLSRIYLRVHYLSDVLAGIVLAVVWLAWWITAIDTLRRRWQSHGKGPPS